MENANWENSLLVSVDADRGELREALGIIREVGGEEMYQRAIGNNGGEVAAVAMVRMALASILNPKRGSSAELEASIIGLALGFPGLGSMSQVARVHGLGRAAVSKRVAIFCEQNGLEPSVYMRNEAVREKCRLSNVRKKKYNR